MKEGYSMRKKLTGFLVGTLMLTLVAGTAAFASENNGGASVKTAEKEKQAIEMEDAAKIALEDAKVTEADAVVYKRIWEYSDNAEIFEIDFLIPGKVKYEYEIAANTGEILENDKENWEADDDREYKDLTSDKTSDPEKVSKALEEAADTAIIFHEKELWEKEDDFEYQGLLHPETVTEKKDGESSAAISKTKAKEIALGDANLSENDVTITKCRMDYDDGAAKYEVEFRTPDGYEYEYEIDVETGKILDKDVELGDD